MKIVCIRDGVLPISCFVCKFRYLAKCELTGCRCSDEDDKRAGTCPFVEVDVPYTEEPELKTIIDQLKHERFMLIDSCGRDYSGVHALDYAIEELEAKLEDEDD